MFKTSKNAKTRSKKKIKSSNFKDLNKEIVGIIIISIGILSLVSLYSESTGSIGKLIKSIFEKIAGSGAFLIPYIILIVGILFTINKLNLNENKKSISLVIIFIAFLTITEINSFGHQPNVTFINSLKYSLSEHNISQSGGFIGVLFSFFFLKLFGVIGSYIIISSLVLIAFILLTNFSLVEFIKKIGSRFRAGIKSSINTIKEFIYIDNTNINYDDEDGNQILDMSKSNNDIINIDKEKLEIDQKIKILDYTKETNPRIRQELKENDSDKSNKVDDFKNGNQVILENINPSINNDNYISYKFPNLNLLESNQKGKSSSEKKEIIINAKKLEETLLNFGIEAKVNQISKGPTITRYELQPAPGIKVSRIVNLADDIALSLASSDIRIEAPIPGKAAVGIEVPNKEKVNVYLKEVLESSEYQETSTKLPFALGKDIAGKPVIANIEKMPHLLIAGATGSGKSVCINTLIMSILYKSKPDEIKLLMIDPKVVELSIYNGIPHLLIPVVTDPKKASGALNWAVQEMTKRYGLFAQKGVRDIFSYNNKVENDEINEKMPQIVIIIDELADLMMVSPGEVEDYICRIAQMARAAGIHLIVATQRPSVDVITGTIKANIPSRISFAVSSQADSRTILDMGGAEKLLGKGDMLFHPVGESKPKRLQGAYIDEKEVERIVEYLRDQGTAEYQDEIVKDIESGININTDNCDELLDEAINLVVLEGQASISLLQRRLKIGYARAARIIDAMEERSIVGGYEGSKPRKVLISEDDLDV